MTTPADPDAQPTGPLGRSHTVWWAILFVVLLAALGYGYVGRRAVGTTVVPVDTAVVRPPAAPTAPPTASPAAAPASGSTSGGASSTAP